MTGLRASELRGLHWADVDLKKAELHVRQRADRYGVIGAPKSKAGQRTIPLGPQVVNTLREWKLACRSGELVFPTRNGRVEHHPDLARKIQPVLKAAGLIGRQAEVHRAARAAPFLRFIVHQPPAGRWPRTPGEGGAGAARPRLDRDDAGHLRPPLPARRRWRRACRGRAHAARLDATQARHGGKLSNGNILI